MSALLNVGRDVGRDVRYAARGLRRSPGFVAVALLTLTLGMGANTALLSLVNSLALRPLAVPDPDSVVHVGMKADGGRALFSYLDFLDYQAGNHTFSSLAAFNKAAAPIGDTAPGPDDGDSPLMNPDRIHAYGLIVSASYFELLGAHTELGRTFTADEDRVPGANPVIVLSHSFWQRRLQSDPAIVGKTIRLSGTVFTVLGIMAADFVGLAPEIPDFWAPITMRDALVVSWYARTWSTDRDARCLALAGRLGPGISREQAQADLRVIEQRLAADRPKPGNRAVLTAVRVTPGSTYYNLEDYRPLVIPLFGAFGLVLLVACANVANLLLSRATARRREISVRLAIGATRGRLIRQLLTENVLLATIGGALALGVSLVIIEVVAPRVAYSLPLPNGLVDTMVFDPQPDWRVFALTLLLSTLTGIAFGLAPAVFSSHTDVNAGLRGAAITGGRRSVRLHARNLLVIAQVAVCMALLICAGLVTRNVRSLQRVDTGLRTKDVYSIAVGAATGAERQVRMEVAARLAALPNVTSVAEVRRVPLSGGMPTVKVSVPRQGFEPASAGFNIVSPEYFDLVQLRATRGRTFSTTETATASVIIISEAAAQAFWPGDDPLGKRLIVNGSDREVIGVVPNVRSSIVWRNDPPMIYLPRSDADAPLYLLVHAAGSANATETIRRTAIATAGTAEFVVRRVDDAVAFQVSPFKAVATAAGVLGGLALVMASIGIYGVISYLVAQRTREFGIRLAMGATRSDLLTMVMRSGLRLAIAGVVVGVLCGVGAAQVIAVVLTDVSRFDPVAFGGVALIFLTVAFVACVVPAHRAANVDPLRSLQSE